VRDCGARPSSASYLGSENIKRETSAGEAEEARAGMEKMSEVYREKGERLYLPEG
jgi:phosphomethylpyrimidine synthase